MPDCHECLLPGLDKDHVNLDIYNREYCEICHELLPDNLKLPNWEERKRHVTPGRPSWGIDEVLDI